MTKTREIYWPNATMLERATYLKRKIQSRLRKSIHGQSCPFCPERLQAGERVYTTPGHKRIAHTDCVERIIKQAQAARQLPVDGAPKLDPLALTKLASEASKAQAKNGKREKAPVTPPVLTEVEWSPAANERAINRLKRSTSSDSQPERLEISIGNLNLVITFKQ